MVAGLLHKSYWPVEVPSSSPLHVRERERGRGWCLLYNVNMYNPPHFMLEDRESTQIQVLWDMMPLQLLNKKLHTKHIPTTDQQPSPLQKSAKTQTQNQHSFSSSSSSLLSPHIFHWLVLPIPVRHHIKSHCL